MTMVPRTGPRSTSSACRTTSLNQAEKSSDCAVTPSRLTHGSVAAPGGRPKRVWSSLGRCRTLFTMGHIATAPPRVRDAAAALDRAELAMMEADDEPAQLRYAKALTDWGDAGGYDAEVLWDACCVAALDLPYDTVRWRDVGTLSGGEQKRL